MKQPPMKQLDTLVLKATNDLETPKSDASLIAWIEGMLAKLDEEDQD